MYMQCNGVTLVRDNEYCHTYLFLFSYEYYYINCWNWFLLLFVSCMLDRDCHYFDSQEYIYGVLEYTPLSYKELKERCISICCLSFLNCSSEYC